MNQLNFAVNLSGRVGQVAAGARLGAASRKELEWGQPKRAYKGGPASLQNQRASRAAAGGETVARGHASARPHGPATEAGDDFVTEARAQLCVRNCRCAVALTTIAHTGARTHTHECAHTRTRARAYFAF